VSARLCDSYCLLSSWKPVVHGTLDADEIAYNFEFRKLSVKKFIDV